MLKFIRKFQLVILAVGGTLLMVVFLLEPVLTSFQRSQLNRPVARLADGGRITLLDTDRARSEIDLARRVAPVVFLPREFGGLGLSPDSGATNEHLYHWIMLAWLAEEAGLVGGAQDGRQLIEMELQVEIRELAQQLQFALMQGAVSWEEAQEQLGMYENMRRSQLYREVAATASYSRTATEDDIWRALARFMGAYRLVRLYNSAPAFSPAGAIAGLRELGDSIAVDAALIPGSVLGAGLPDPDESELESFFEPRAGLEPDEDEFGVGYAQPARVRMGWLVLSREDFNAAVEIDRVELRKMWELDSRKPENQREYPGDFASERANLERAFRAERVDQLMVEADRVIRAQVLQATRALPREDGRMQLPENWDTIRPSLDTIAEAVVTRLGEQGVPLRTPTVEIRDDAWLSSRELSQIPGVGNSFFRVGSRTLLTQEVPTLIRENGLLPDLNLQVGVPLVDPAATDQNGNRYYLLVFAHREAGPARSIDDAGRRRVIDDYKSLEGYRGLLAMLDGLNELASAEGGVRAAVDRVMENADPSRVVRPGVLRNIRVSSLQVSPSVQARNVDPRLNDERFRRAVLEVAEGIDPLTPPENLADDPRGLAVALPSSRSVAVARIIAPRPFTTEDFTSNVQTALGFLTNRTLQTALEGEDAEDPFSYEVLRRRFGLEPIGDQQDL